MDIDQFYILDGHSLIYKFFYAQCADLTAPDGTPTKAVYLFTKAILKLVRMKKPAYLACVFDDKSIPLVKQLRFPEYKANRKATISEVTIQTELIKQVVQLLGICSLVMPGYEADDIVATLTTACTSEQVHTTIITGDKDLAALLVNPYVRLYDPQKEEYQNASQFQIAKGISPSYMEDYLAMVGDRVDNIPPLGGFGEVTATKLLSKYSSINSIIEHRNSLPFKLRKQLELTMEDGSLERNRYLVRLNRSVPMTVSNDDLAFNGLDLERARPLFNQLGFKRW